MILYPWESSHQKMVIYMVQDKNAIVNIVSISINIKFSFTFHHFIFIQSIFSLYELTIKMVKISDESVSPTEDAFPLILDL